MCLAVPARIMSIGEKTAASCPATVVVAGVERAVDLVLVPEAVVGDYVVTHSGYAMSLLSRERAEETLEMLGLEADLMQ
jgi:hydrogenase expression/formation protein HypC